VVIESSKFRSSRFQVEDSRISTWNLELRNLELNEGGTAVPDLP